MADSPRESPREKDTGKPKITSRIRRLFESRSASMELEAPPDGLHEGTTSGTASPSISPGRYTRSSSVETVDESKIKKIVEEFEKLADAPSPSCSPIAPKVSRDERRARRKGSSSTSGDRVDTPVASPMRERPSSKSGGSKKRSKPAGTKRSLMDLAKRKFTSAPKPELHPAIEAAREKARAEAKAEAAACANPMARDACYEMSEEQTQEMRGKSAQRLTNAWRTTMYLPTQDFKKGSDVVKTKTKRFPTLKKKPKASRPKVDTADASTSTSTSSSSTSSSSTSSSGGRTVRLVEPAKSLAEPTPSRATATSSGSSSSSRSSTSTAPTSPPLLSISSPGAGRINPRFEARIAMLRAAFTTYLAPKSRRYRRTRSELFSSFPNELKKLSDKCATDPRSPKAASSSKRKPYDCLFDLPIDHDGADTPNSKPRNPILHATKSRSRRAKISHRRTLSCVREITDILIDEDLLPIFAQWDRQVEAPLITEAELAITDPKQQLEHMLNETIAVDEIEVFSDAIEALSSELCSAKDAEQLAQAAAAAAEKAIASGEELDLDKAPPIFYEQRGDCLVVMGGLSHALLELLLDLTFEDSLYINQLLVTYHYFTEGKVLLDLLLAALALPEPPADASEMERTKFVLKRERAMFVLRRWVEYYAEDFMRDRTLLSELSSFLTKLSTSENRDCAIYARQLRAIVQSEKRAFRLRDAHSIRLADSLLSRLVPTKQSRMHVSSSTSRFLIFPADEIAQQLTIYEHSRFRLILPSELRRQVWNKTNPEELSPNVTKVIKRFNETSYWIASEIVMQPNIKQRIAVLRKVINIAELCLEYRNFNTVMAIITGLYLASIQRLKRTWKGLPKKTLDSFEAITELFSHSRNYTVYRTHVAAQPPPINPYLGIYLRDLTFIEVGNVDFLEQAPTAVNFDKLRMIALSILDVEKHQKHAYSFEPINDVMMYITNPVVLSEEQLYAYSNRIEAKEDPGGYTGYSYGSSILRAASRMRFTSTNQ